MLLKKLGTVHKRLEYNLSQYAKFSFGLFLCCWSNILLIFMVVLWYGMVGYGPTVRSYDMAWWSIKNHGKLPNMTVTQV